MQKKKINPNIIFLGIVSLLTDISSEMIFSVFAVFFTTILNASTALLGIIEGIADFSASSLDAISGYLSDKTGKRKFIAAAGYGFSTLAKIILVISSTITSASAFRIIERLGKSFRGPPRDAWLASFTQKENRGFSFAVHKALDKTGAIIGPLIAYSIIRYTGENLNSFNLMFSIALIPAVLSVFLIFFIKEKPELPKKQKFISNFQKFNKNLSHFFISAGIFSLAYFSFGFLLLKAYITGFDTADVILLYALFNISFVIFALPMGKISDYIGRKLMIKTGYILYFIMCVGFIFAETKFQIILLFILFGIFYSIDESQTKAYISDLEAKKRASAIGAYNFITGLIYVPASVIAGFLWGISPNITFGFGAAVSISAFLVFNLKK